MKKFALMLSITIIITTFIILLSWKNSGQEVKSSPIDGAWLTVWGRYNGEVYSPKKPYQFKMFSNGYFALIAQDSLENLTLEDMENLNCRVKLLKRLFFITIILTI